MADMMTDANRAMNVMRMQDEDLVADLMARHEQMRSTRAPFEKMWRDVDRRVTPGMAGGFGNSNAVGDIRGLENFDSTAPRQVPRTTAALKSVTVPINQRWSMLATTNPDLNRLHAVQLWCEMAADRLFACRYNPLAGFDTQISEDIRQSATYGTAPLWIGEIPGQHLFYRSLHLSQIFIEENFAGRVDTVIRQWEMTLRQAVQEFGEWALPDRLRKKWADERTKCHGDRIEFIHVIRPNGEYRRGMFGMAGMKVESITFSPADKWIVRHKGFRTMPIAVSRYYTGTNEIYGRSPTIDVMGAIKTVNEQKKTILKAGQKAVDPAWALSEDLELSVLKTKPNGLNPGLLDDRGEFLAKPLPMGGDLNIGREMVMDEQTDIRSAMLEDFFKLLTDPSDRMTATQVIETAEKQGILISEFSSRFNTEKLAPMIERELELLMSVGQIPEMPPEMKEAGAKLRVIMTNPAERMSRAGEAGGFARWAEMAVQLAPFDEDVIDVVETGPAMRGLAEVLGVRPSWIASPERAAQKRQARRDAKQQQMLAQAAAPAAGAALDLAKANQIAMGG